MRISCPHARSGGVDQGGSCMVNHRVELCLQLVDDLATRPRCPMTALRSATKVSRASLMAGIHGWLLVCFEKRFPPFAG